MNWYPAPAGRLLRMFHRALGSLRTTPTPVIPEAERRLRVRLLVEELVELVQALEAAPETKEQTAARVAQVIAVLPHTPGDVEVDLENLALEIADLIAVSHGTAAHHGIDSDLACEAVHFSNMSKLPDHEPCQGRGCEDCDRTGKGTPLTRADGKVLKAPGHRPPDLTAALQGVRG